MRWLTVLDVLRVHAEFGKLNRSQVRLGMGPNWPRDWDDVGDDGIFEANT